MGTEPAEEKAGLPAGSCSGGSRTYRPLPLKKILLLHGAEECQKCSDLASFFFSTPSFKPLLPPYGLLFASVGGGIVSTHTQTYEVIEVADKGSVSQKDSQGLLM